MRIPLDKSYPRTLVVPLRVYDQQGEGYWDLLGAIDTGASTVTIPRDAARLLGYPVDGVETTRVICGDGVVYAPKITLGRIDVESASATGVEAVCHDLPEECAVDALLGLSFLTKFKVAFDFDAWEMELVPRA